MKPVTLLILATLFACCTPQADQKGSHSAPSPGRTPDSILTVTGPIPADSLGLALIHEHVFLDWSGADSIRPQDWEEEAAFEAILPHLLEVKKHGVRSFLECTPAYLGRNPSLLHRLSVESGLQILTNTGFYGARQNRFIPAFAFEATAEELAGIWVKEFEEGVGEEGLTIRPGFIKIGVDADSSLSDMHRKLARAAALTHLRTGLAIVAHTGIDTTAALQLAILEEAGVAPDAFVWTHAQNGTPEGHVRLAKRGAWVSLDGLGWVAPADHQGDSTALYQYVGYLKNLKAHGLLHRTLISHDAGWYTHSEAGGGEYKAHTPIFTLLKPLLLKEGFTEEDFRQLLVDNPREAYAIRVRRLKAE
ncbi:MAG: hypothetical protein J5I94_03530 [Phaeodactylibacter sp.]|nr:hypothetical protein [Phaeodactylibacter sp.]